MRSSELVEIVVLVSVPIFSGLAAAEYHRRRAVRVQRREVDDE